MGSKNLLNTFVELIRRASSDLPIDVVSAIEKGLLTEKRNSITYNTLQMILKNIELAKEKSLPMCQDTGTAESMQEGIWKELGDASLMQFIRLRGGDVRREF